MQGADDLLEGKRAPVIGRHRRTAGVLLIVASLVLPLTLVGLGALLAREQARRETDIEVTRAAEAAAEYTARLLESALQRTDLANEILRGMTDEEILRREREIHDRLAAIPGRMSDVQTFHVFAHDREGLSVASGALYPLPSRDRSFLQREFNQALRDPAAPPFHISRAYVGDETRRPFFTVARRRVGSGNPSSPDGYDGIVAASIDVAGFGAALRRLLGGDGEAIAIVRSDGEILARSLPWDPSATPRLPPHSELVALMASGRERGLLANTSHIDGSVRIAAIQRVPGWPVYVSAARPQARVNARWLEAVTPLLLTGLPVTLALLLLALLAYRRSVALSRLAAGLEARVAERTGALAASEARLTGILASTPVGVMEVDREGKVTFANDAASKLLGVSASEATGRGFDALAWGISTLDGSPLISHDLPAARALRGETVRNYRHRVRQGGTGRDIILSVNATPRRDDRGEVVGASAAVMDVTALHEVQAALSESEARVRAITDAMPQFVWSADPEGRIDYQNRRFYALTGTSPAEALDVGWQVLVHPDDRARTLQLFNHSLSTGEPYEMEHRMRLGDGNYRWFLSRALPVRDAETAVIRRWFGTSTDIEDVVAARQALARSREELEAIVADRTRDLAETQARLAHAQRMEALGQLAGGIAHDFNNVLQAVTGGARLIEAEPGNEGRVRRLGRMIAEAAHRGSSVTKRLLALARRADLRAELISAGETLGEMAEVLQHTLGTGIEVMVTVPAGTPRFLADKGGFETTLINLATNARDAMAGNGLLTLSARAETVTGEGGRLRPGGYVCIEVTDTGIGMDLATLTRASEPFFTTKGLGKGTGLGLAMARGFAEQSGGAFAIQSAPGTGTTVQLWFPADEAAVDNIPAREATRAKRRGDRARILVVDDEALVREITAEALEATGFSVATAGGANEALELLDAGERVDLIVSDLSMPAMDGLALIREAQRRRRGLPAVLMTGFATDAAELAIGGALNGSFSLVRKPVEAAVLAERIAVMLEGIAEDAAD